ncbi:hypothetical protein KPL70_011410 [Citrus sinensis]|nr:hypothetical protein KPL70_011410 [Citrus sinensis]
MGKKHTGPVRKRRPVGASRVDSPPAGSPSHISISEGDRSPASTSGSYNSHSELPPPRSTPRVIPRFPSKRPTPHPKKKGSYPVQEVGREVKKFVERLRGAQRSSDVLEESRLWRAGLIYQSLPPAPGGDSLGGASGSHDSAVPQKSFWPPRAPRLKGKSQGTSHSASKGTPHSNKRKFGLVSAFLDELREGDLDPASNKEVSHLACCFYYSTENVSSEVAEETDKMSLSQRYGQVLRVTQEVGFLGASFLLSYCLPDLDSLVAAQSEVGKLRSELQSQVWSVDPELEVPPVQKFVNKATILKTIAERKKSSHARLGTPSESPRVPRALQLLPASDAPTSAAHILGTSESSADRPLETDVLSCFHRKATPGLFTPLPILALHRSSRSRHIRYPSWSYDREGQSTTRPSFFDGNDYPYWKTRMRIYLQALDYEIWEVVCDGPFMPLTKNEIGEDIPKPSREWNELEKRKASLNSKAMNALFCALDKKEFYRVFSCESANEIWYKLEVIYEGTNQVKESKISRYTRQYELFQMEQNESVYSMYTRFMDIVNTLGALGKTFSNSEKVKKIIRSLPKEWRLKRTAIEEVKDLNILPIDDLIGSLISYEEDLAAERGNEERKKNIALKVTKYESDGVSEPDDEELAMLARRFRKFFKKTSDRRKFRNFKNQKEKKEVIICYECKKPGHIRSECPLLNKLKNKAMVATWDDSDEDSSDEDESQEVSNLALMALGDDDDLNEVSDPTYDELYDAFKEMHDELMKIYGELQEESSKENQEHTPQENQKDRQEEQTNMELEQQEGSSQTLTKEWRYVSSHPKDLILGDPSRGLIFLPQTNPFHSIFVKPEIAFLSSFFLPTMAGGDKSKGKHVTKKRKDDHGDYSDFMLIHFPRLQLRKHFLDNFKTRSVITPYFVNLSNMENLEICDKSLKDLIIAMGWKNVLVVNDPYYENLVKVFYSNMDTELSNRIVTNVGRVHIEFDVALLNSILGTPNEGLEIYSARAKIKQPWFSLENAVRKICRRRDLSTVFCNSPLKSQALPLQTRILHYVLHHVITPRAGHADEVSRLDVAILDCILEEKVLNIGYIILHHMLSTPNLAKRSLPYAALLPEF